MAPQTQTNLRVQPIACFPRKLAMETLCAIRIRLPVSATPAPAAQQLLQVYMLSVSTSRKARDGIP